MNLGDVVFSNKERTDLGVLNNNYFNDKMEFCYIDDDRCNKGDVFVDLLKNPERYTGYHNPHARKIWEAIYGENCFTDQPLRANGTVDN